MTQIVQHVAYGMNSGYIPGMSTKQLVAAFFLADTNMSSISPAYRKGIRHNMGLIADEMSDRLDRAKSKRNKVQIEVPLMCMRVIIRRSSI